MKNNEKCEKILQNREKQYNMKNWIKQQILRKLKMKNDLKIAYIIVITQLSNVNPKNQRENVWTWLWKFYLEFKFELQQGSKSGQRLEVKVHYKGTIAGYSITDWKYEAA